jgi:hypothetical protein
MPKMASRGGILLYYIHNKYTFNDSTQTFHRLLNISVPLPKRSIVFALFPFSLKEASPVYVTAYAGTHCPLSFIFHNNDYLNSRSRSRKLFNSLLTFSNVTCPDKVALLLFRSWHGKSEEIEIEENRSYY